VVPFVTALRRHGALSPPVLLQSRDDSPDVNAHDGAATPCEIAMTKLLLCPLSMLCAAAAFAQGALPVEFPAASKSVSAAVLKEAIAGKTFTVDLADGSHWRLEYKSNGYFFVNTSSGFNGSGDWRADEERLCTRLRGEALSCNEVRDVGGVLYLKRISGEVIVLKQR
jgi:hypothetical protein